MQKVDTTKWGGSKVRSNLKPLWQDPATDDAEFGVYQQSLLTTIKNTNELIDAQTALEAELEAIKSRPF